MNANSRGSVTPVTNEVTAPANINDAICSFLEGLAS